MSFTNQTLKSGPYNTNGSVSAFSGTFHCLAEDQIAVTLTDADGVESTLTLNTDYTVAGTFPTDSFTVNTVAAYASGQTITISRATPLTQESSFGNSGPYYPKTHETAYDKNMVAIQEVQEQVDRCVKNSVSSTSSIDSAEYLAACETAAAQAAASAATVTQSATRTVALRATANVDITTGLVAGQSIDGVVLTAGDRVMLDQQSAATEDGIYVAVAAGTGTRASDWAVGESVSGRLVTVTEGTANAGFMFLVENVDGSDVVGTDGLTLGVQLKSISADDKHLVRRAGAVVEESITTAGAALLDDVDASAQRTTLGLGTIATQDADSVAITGGSITGVDIGESGVLSVDALLYIEDQKTSGTGPGSATGATYNKRDLNTKVVDTISGASLASSVITLPAGTYYTEFSSPCRGGANQTVHRVRLRNTSDSVTVAVGTPLATVDTDTSGFDTVNEATGDGHFTIAAQKNFELQHYVADSNAMGIAVSDGEVEVYSRIKIWKVA